MAAGLRRGAEPRRGDDNPRRRPGTGGRSAHRRGRGSLGHPGAGVRPGGRLPSTTWAFKSEPIPSATPNSLPRSATGSRSPTPATRRCSSTGCVTDKSLPWRCTARRTLIFRRSRGPCCGPGTDVSAGSALLPWGIALKTCTTTGSARSGCPAGTQDGCSCSETRPLQCRCSPVRAPPWGCWPPPPYWREELDRHPGISSALTALEPAAPDGQRTPAGRVSAAKWLAPGYPACLLHPPDRRPGLDEVPGYDAPDKHRRGNLHREPRPWAGPPTISC